MPLLGRTNSRLLRVVNNMPHATNKDHINEATPPLQTIENVKSNGNPQERVQALKQDTAQTVDLDDVNREPESSDDDATPARQPDLETLSRQVPVKDEKKRASPVDDDGDIFHHLGSQSKRAKISSGVSTGRSKAGVQYGVRASQARSQDNAALLQSSGSQSKRQKKDGATFKAPRSVEFASSPRSDVELATFKKIHIPVRDDDQLPSSPLQSSPLSTPPDSPSDVEILDLTGDGIVRVKCQVCQDIVDRLIQQEYEDTYNDGRPLTFRRQEAFCRFHRQYAAKKVWMQRQYPVIDWTQQHIEKRMRKQCRRLTSILKQETCSTWRSRYARQIASRADRTGEAMFKSSQNEDNLVSAGYYGPRGQKVMLEYISRQLFAALRDAATEDPLLSSVGITGGIAGFVHDVLVPEMAVGLIAEDMGKTHEKAVEILKASKGLGDVLSEEVREDVVLQT